MSERWLGIVVGADQITAVDAEIPDDDAEPIIIQADHSWPLQKGDRPAAYAVMHQHIAGYAKENHINRAVIKASALSRQAMRKGHLSAAELRGVIMCALAPITKTECLAKAHVSKNFGERKADEYIKDNKFWSKEVTGKQLRVGSREAALVILAARDDDG